ncbi:MAG: glycosyltransferase [Clostridia bacterium]|nr:glycosyltransferase [Clostridia bacterium]
MKILHILSTDRLSGAENVHLDILRTLKDENEVIYASPDGPVREAVESAGVRFIPFDPESPKNIKKLWKDEKPDVVHAADPRMSFKCAMAGIPFISQLHSNCPWMKKLCPNSIALRYAAKRAAAVIAVSQSIADEYIFSSSVEDKLRVIPNTVDREKIVRLAAEPLEKQFDLVFVGRLVECKRPSMFVDIVDLVSEKIPGVRAAMVGDGDLRKETEQYIKDKGLSNIELFGFDPNPYKYVSRSKICVVTSSVEGFGLVAVEAMTLGKPTLAYPVGGLTEIAEKGGDLFTSVEEAADKAQRLLTDQKLYGEASRKAELASREWTDTEKYMEKIKELYAACAAEK